MKPSILFIGKKNDYCTDCAIGLIQQHFDDYRIITGNRNDSLPIDSNNWQGDYIISYLSPWIIPAALLKKAHQGAINFHPGPPEYPGIGCTNFAIYHEEKTFGITCHHMNPKVDSGKIIAVKRFPLYESDSVYSLTQRCYGHILALFYDIMALILDAKALPQSHECWQRKPFTRKALNALCRLTPEMSKTEIKKRIRAVTFPDAPGAYMATDNVKQKIIS